MLDLANIIVVNHAAPLGWPNQPVSVYGVRSALEANPWQRSATTPAERVNFSILRRVALLERALNPSDLEAIRRQR